MSFQRESDFTENKSQSGESSLPVIESLPGCWPVLGPLHCFLWSKDLQAAVWFLVEPWLRYDFVENIMETHQPMFIIW